MRGLTLRASDMTYDDRSVPNTMHALGFHEFGGPDVVRLLELPTPVPGPGEALVRVEAATVNPTDVLMREGKQVSMMDGLAAPFVGGMEFAGHVCALGPGVLGLRLGQPVVGIVNPRRPQRGAHAEFVVAAAGALAPLPPDADLCLAATLPMNGLTALMVIEALSLPPGASVLVTGAVGAVGGYVIPLARREGLVVVADAKPGDAEYLRRIGAQDVVPRDEGMFVAVRERWPSGVDGLVDAALIGTPAGALVRAGGVAVTLRRNSAVVDGRLIVRHVSVTDRATDSAGLSKIVGLWIDGVLEPRVARRLTIQEGAQAHRLVTQGGLRGRVILTFSQ